MSVSMRYRLQVRHGLPYPLVRARKRHVCDLCDDTIPVGMRHQVWTSFERGMPPVRMRGHDLCVNSSVVETYMVGPFERTCTDQIGINGDGYVDGELGAESWWQLIEALAPFGWWIIERNNGVRYHTAHVWPPDLHGWLISLPPIEWAS